MDASIIIPISANHRNNYDCFESVIQSLLYCEFTCELIIVRDFDLSVGNILLPQAIDKCKVKIIDNRYNKHGSANARLIGIELSQATYLLFTDADCIVPLDWVQTMLQKANEMNSGIYGPVMAYRSGVEDKIERAIIEAEEATDKRRLEKVRKVPLFSFQNVCITRLPEFIIDTHSDNFLEDMDLSIQMFLNKKPMIFLEKPIVLTIYPKTIWEATLRKRKHGKGVAYLENKYKNIWTDIGFNTAEHYINTTIQCPPPGLIGLSRDVWLLLRGVYIGNHALQVVK